MTDRTDAETLSLVIHEDSDTNVDDESLIEPRQPVATLEHRIAELEDDLGHAADEEAETAQRLDAERTRRAALDQELHEARQDAARLLLDEATREAGAIAAEAEELLEESRIEAERKAERINKQTFDQAREMLAEAKREAAAIVDAGREELKVLEADATQRVEDLEGKRQELAHRLAVMETLYKELQETLQLVAETSVNELAEAQESLKQLDPAETQQPPTEPTSEQTTPSPPPEEGSVADLDAASTSGGHEPDSIEIPPLSDPGSLTADT